MIEKIQALLRRNDACVEAVEWVDTLSSVEEFWATCEHPEWMIWLAVHLQVEPELLAAAVSRYEGPRKGPRKYRMSLLRKIQREPKSILSLPCRAARHSSEQCAKVTSAIRKEIPLAVVETAAEKL
jgi:hypothetical protein